MTFRNHYFVLIGALVCFPLHGDNQDRVRGSQAASQEETDDPASSIDGFQPFDRAAMWIESSPQDGEAEVTLELESDREFEELRVYGPSGALVFRTQSAFMGEVRIELADAPLERILDRFPEGEYLMVAQSNQERLNATVRLTHSITPAPELVVHRQTDQFRIQWREIPGAVGYQIEIESHDESFVLETLLDPATTHYVIDFQLLDQGTDYEVSVSAMSASGNAAESETSFSLR